jgi:hypothetical protein
MIGGWECEKNLDVNNTNYSLIVDKIKTKMAVA